MKRLLKEIFWMGGTMLIALIVGLIIFGTRLLDGNPVDVQLYDTYYVFPKPVFITVTWVILIVSTYAIRALCRR